MPRHFDRVTESDKYRPDRNTAMEKTIKSTILCGYKNYCVNQGVTAKFIRERADIKISREGK